ncbi:FAM206 family protein isoform X1 [Eutrema salsugineum]|uniref:FAM206 family protein isoform X1 n=1 Tax=Eutrema salsugineum TaxID=72664 RepID=UPI000CED0E4A|nr:FAM206 family protein isoform X1 [Eutrema salsugineum]
MEIHKTDEAAKNPEIEDIVELTKQKQSEELEHCDEQQQQQQAEEDEKKRDEDEDELRNLLLSDIGDLPLSPPSATQVNFVSYFITDFTKSGHDQYIYRHANGLCVIGLAPTHIAFKDEGGITNIDFNVGKSDRSVLKVSGKRKKVAFSFFSLFFSCFHSVLKTFTSCCSLKLRFEIVVYSNAVLVQNAMRSESNTALCKVSTANDSYIVRCCVKGSLLEVNERLIKQPQLLNSSADREGYIAIIMPRPADWTKNKESLITLEEYKEKKEVSL